MKRINFNKAELLKNRHKHVLKRVREGNKHIRLRVTKSNLHVYVQALDDLKQKTVASSSSLSLKLNNGNRENCVKLARDLSLKLKKLNISQVVLDRGGHSYSGRIEIIANTLREEGIKL